MLEYLKQELNRTYTENGAVTNESTLDPVLDFFAIGGALRSRSKDDIIRLFSRAFSADRELALKTLFYIRDIRGGLGERRTFRVILKYLGNFDPDITEKNIGLVPEYGRWDDILVLLDTNSRKSALELIQKQFIDDMNSNHPSLLGKWLPSENASSEENKLLAQQIRRYLNLSPKQYRKALSSLRAKLRVVERDMSTNRWQDIDYAIVPSRASLIYRKAFDRHDHLRYQQYLEDVKAGKSKINTKALYPYDVVKRVLDGSLTLSDVDILDTIWNNLPNYFTKPENSIVVADVSGSMYPDAIIVALSLALYAAERNTGVFHNYFMTFSAHPQLVQITGNNICEKIRNIANANWGMNTDVEAVFDVILNTAIKHHIPQEEMIKRIFIISDMEFDMATSADDTIFEAVKHKYEMVGYEIPKLVFWNADARHDNFPVTQNEYGVQLVSGYSPILFRELLGNEELTPYQFMLAVLEKYKVNV